MLNKTKTMIHKRQRLYLDCLTQRRSFRQGGRAARYHCKAGREIIRGLLASLPEGSECGERTLTEIKEWKDDSSYTQTTFTILNLRRRRFYLSATSADQDVGTEQRPEWAKASKIIYLYKGPASISLLSVILHSILRSEWRSYCAVYISFCLKNMRLSRQQARARNQSH